MRRVTTMAKPEQLYQCVTLTCNYIYDPEWEDKEGGIPRGTQFAALPENWRCPCCGAGKKTFRRLRQPETKEEQALGDS